MGIESGGDPATNWAGAPNNAPTFIDWVPVMPGVPVSVTVSVSASTMLNFVLKVCDPLSAAVN